MIISTTNMLIFPTTMTSPMILPNTNLMILPLTNLLSTVKTIFGPCWRLHLLMMILCTSIQFGTAGNYTMWK
ncbi:hypothetical protein V8B55DRAFT_1526325 [Mucor lusitanicus]